MQSRSFEQVDFSEVQRQARVALEAGDMVRLQNMLLPFLREDDRTRGAGENLFVYRTLGAMYAELGKAQESLMAYEQAYGYDLRDKDVLEILADVEFKKPVEDLELHILLELLVFHRYRLKTQTVAQLYKVIGDHHQANGNMEDARLAYEKAFEVRPSDTELINALLSVSEASGNAEAITQAREKLLTTLSIPESRAAVLVSIGDDHLQNDDEARALSAYEQALLECMESVAAHGRILILAEKNEDWERALNSLHSLTLYAQDAEEKSKYLIKSASIYKDKLNDTRRAVQLFNEVLDINPEQTDVFELIVSILQEQKDYLAIEAHYEAMIDRQQRLKQFNPKLMAVLCRNLGDLRLQNLDNVRGAAQAYQVASELFPRNVGFHVVLGDLYSRNDDTLELAVREQREVLRLAPDRLDAVDALARLYRRMSLFDESLCIYRVLSVLQRVDDEGRAIVERFTTNRTPRIEIAFTEEYWQLLRPPALDMAVHKIFQLTVPAMAECFANDLDFYGLNERDSAVDMSEPTFFTRTMSTLAVPLGFGEVPYIFSCPSRSGVSNAYLIKRSFLVNPNFLSGRDEREVVFTCAKAMTLIRPEYYMLQLGRKAVQGIINTIFKTALPSLNIEMDRSMVKVMRTLEKNLTPLQMGTLRSLVQGIVERGANINTRLYMESVEDLANRVGLLFCDDPHVIERMLSEEAVTISSRSVADRVGSLLLWALSEQYSALRKLAGISINEA